MRGVGSSAAVFPVGPVFVDFTGPELTGDGR